MSGGASTALGGGMSMDFFLRATSEPPARASDSPCSGAAQVVKSCPFAALGSPGGRIGSVLDVGKRLRRMYQCFHRWIQISTGPQQCADNYHDPPKFSIQSSLGNPKHRRMRSRGPSDPRSIPERVRAPICIRKKQIIWARWHPSPLKTSITRGPPVIAVAVSLDPILLHR